MGLRHWCSALLWAIAVAGDWLRVRPAANNTCGKGTCSSPLYSGRVQSFILKRVRRCIKAEPRLVRGGWWWLLVVVGSGKGVDPLSLSACVAQRGVHTARLAPPPSRPSSPPWQVYAKCAQAHVGTNIVHLLGDCVRGGGHAAASVPDAVVTVINIGVRRQRHVSRRGGAR